MNVLVRKTLLKFPIKRRKDVKTERRRDGKIKKDGVFFCEM